MTEDRVLVLVHWVDSVGSGGFWNSIDNLVRDGLEVESIGWIVFEDEEKLTIVCHWGEHGVGGDMTIPKCAITKMWEISM